MKILSHYALDMNQKTKISTKFPRSKVGVATAVLSLGGVLVYSVGMINPLYASQRTNLEVNGVQNRVQYLNTLIVTGETNGVKLQYDKDSVQALGSLNMQNLVVGKGNSSSTSSVVFGGTNNANNGENSFIAWGEGVRVDSSAQNVAVISSQRANVNASNTIVMHGNNINTSQGSNIMVLNAEDKTINGNYVTVLGNSSASANRTFVLGDNIVNERSNTFVFNGKDGAFVPDQDSAFYANSKVAINADNAKAQLDINGGAMIGIRGDRSVPKWNYKGTIARFARGHEIGLCALDGKNNQRIPLSESARKFWLCTETQFVELPRNAVTNDRDENLPDVWNQQTGRWQKGLWVYGSKNKKGHFLCADGFVPDNSDPIGKTGVKCIACEWAKSGDLNCGEKKKVEETTPTCPQVTTYNKTANKCEGSRETTCAVFPGKQGTYTPNKTIEEFDGTKWVVKQKCQLTCPTGYLKKTDPATQTEYCEKIEKRLRLRFMYPNTTLLAPAFKKIAVSIDGKVYANSSVKYADQQINLLVRKGRPHPLNRVVSAGDPYLEVEVPLRDSSSKSFEIKILDTSYGTWENLAMVSRYNLTPWVTSVVPNRIDWDYWRCFNIVDWFCTYPGGEINIRGEVSDGDVWDNDLVDVVYYFDVRSQTPPSQPQVPSRWSVPMYYRAEHVQEMPLEKRKSQLDMDQWNSEQDRCWSSIFGLTSSRFYSNDIARFRATACNTSKQPINIFIKEVPVSSVASEIYFYTDKDFTQKAPSGIYDLNTEYAGFKNEYPELYNAGIKGVILSSNWRVHVWMWEKSVIEIQNKYVFRW